MKIDQIKRAALLYPRNTQSRRIISMDGLWHFRIDPDSKGLDEGWQNGINSKEMIPVPASFQDFFTEKDMREYTGDFWYETEVFIPKEWEGLEADIRFGSAAHRAVVYINGYEAAVHEGGFLPFCAPITKAAVYGSLNRVVVRVNNELSETTLPVGVVITKLNGKRMVKPYFDFFNYSGLLRPVNLIATPKAAIIDFSVVHRLINNDAETEYSVETTDSGDISVTVFDENNNIVATANGDAGIITIPNVRLWKVGDSYLYRFKICLHKDGELLDEWYDDIGIRTVEISGENILINGMPVYFKGFGKHEDSDIVGRGYNLAVAKRDFELMKWINANSFRTSHYPYSEEIYQLADREGFLVIDEVPAVGMMISTWNFVAASSGKNTAFFDKPDIHKLLEVHLQTVRDLIARDKNRACVVAWSLFNEPETTSDNAVPYFQKVFETAGECDPQKRPRTFALLMNSQPNICKCYHFCDFISLNRYFGWYVKGGYELDDAEAALRSELNAWAAKGLNKPFLFAEYGADSEEIISREPSVMWSQQYQTEILKMCSKVFDDYGFVKGEQVWNFADFATAEGILRVSGNRKGVFTRQRQPKMAAYYLKERWKNLREDHKN